MRTLTVWLCLQVASSFVFDIGAAEKFMIWPEGKVPSLQKEQCVPYFVWHAPKSLKTKSILISVSGGGYGGCGIEGFEVSPIRDYMLEKGMIVVTMRYRTPRPKGLGKHVTAWQDAQRTVRLVCDLASKRGLDPDSIGQSGCSWPWAFDKGSSGPGSRSAACACRWTAGGRTLQLCRGREGGPVVGSGRRGRPRHPCLPECLNRRGCSHRFTCYAGFRLFRCAAGRTDETAMRTDEG